MRTVKKLKFLFIALNLVLVGCISSPKVDEEAIRSDAPKRASSSTPKINKLEVIDYMVLEDFNLEVGEFVNLPQVNQKALIQNCESIQGIILELDDSVNRIELNNLNGFSNKFKGAEITLALFDENSDLIFKSKSKKINDLDGVNGAKVLVLYSSPSEDCENINYERLNITTRRVL